MRTRLFSSDDIRAIVARVGLDRLMDDVIDALTAAFAGYDPARYEVPVRDGFTYETEEPGLLEWMPAMESGRAATFKVVGYHPSNPATRALPTILSTAFTFETGSGHLLAILDATFATAVRTGAASAVASRVLADPDARVLGLIGCGAQSVTQLHALCRTFPIARVLVYDVDPRAAASLQQRAASFGLANDVEIRSVPPETVMSASDIVSTATSVAIGAGPVVADVDTRAHLHVNAVGSDFPGKTELPLSLLERSLVCPDFHRQAIREGECQALRADQIGPDLPALVQRAGHYAAYRAGPTVFDSTGWALEDHVVIEMLAAHGRAFGLGTEVQIESAGTDPADPYSGFVRLAATATGRTRGARG